MQRLTPKERDTMIDFNGKWREIEEKLSNKLLFIILIASVIASILINMIMRSLWAEARFLGNVFEMQLSFSAEYLKQGYQHMISLGTLEIFRQWQIVDFGFMAAYGCFGVSLALLTGRLRFNSDKNREFSYNIASFMIITPLLDVIENCISLITLSNPLKFPDFLGFFHSLFALIKWTLGGIALLWVLISWSAYSIYKFSSLIQKHA